MRGSMIIRRIGTAAVLASALEASASLTACNTIAGAGQDVTSAGHAVTSGATATKNGS